jgi:predicted dienelactone hydrolase
MLNSRLNVQQILLRLLCHLCAVAIVMLVSIDGNASEREFGVGFSRLSTADPMGGQMQYSLWYPTKVPNSVVRLGPFEFPGTRNAEPAAGQFGLVVISHGTGGSDLGHRDTAIALAKAGFITAAPRHPRDNSRDASGSGQRIVLEGRPRQISAIIDELLKHQKWSTRIDGKRIGAFGFSLGGYTVLAVLGAEPELTKAIDHCGHHYHDDPFCNVAGLLDEAARKARATKYAGPPQSFHDERVCAAVIADPVAVMFSDATLKTIPPVRLLFYRPENETVLNARFHVSRVIRILKQRGDFPDPKEIVVQNANHYSFIAPFPEVVAQSIPEIASDPEGFDRAAFHDVMNSTIVTFFKQALSDCVEN